ncbi:MAG: AlpA family phage regulatory protein [Desulfobulbaceae bacterium]|nr:AlpA family phage regulatory protein [Desulfobulbaceae bacterium]
MQHSLPETGFIRLPQLLAVLPISKSTFWAGLKSGRYPLTPVKLSERCTAFRVEEVKALLEHLANQAACGGWRP